MVSRRANIWRSHRCITRARSTEVGRMLQNTLISGGELKSCDVCKRVLTTWLKARRVFSIYSRIYFTMSPVWQTS